MEGKTCGAFRSELLLEGNHTVPLLQGRETVEKQLFLAKLIHKEYMLRQGNGGENLLGDIGEKPATKRDIALLIHELCDLRYQLISRKV